MARSWPTAWFAVALVLILAALALMRPVDHDESQYVAATVLTANGLIPYRDYAYLQVPLQPFLFAPLAWAGVWTWPVLRLANALLAAAAILSVRRTAIEAGATVRRATGAALLFGACDMLLFAGGTARNDALPLALLAAALVPIERIERDSGTRSAAMLAGLLLAGAAAAKISYALPAVAFGLWVVIRRRSMAGWVVLGAIPVCAFVGWTFVLAPEGFVFGTLTFPARAPAEFYAARLWKLSLAAKAVDTIKFLALGAALPALILVARAAWRQRHLGVLEWLILAGLVAGLLPLPTWRQYLLPMLPPLFVALALIDRVPGAWRTALMVFGAAGLVSTGAAIAMPGTLGFVTAMRDGFAIGRVLDREGITGPIATLSPQFLPATGRLPLAAFATGPFYYRSRALIDPAHEAPLHLMSAMRPRALDTVLIGGEGPATSGDARWDDALAGQTSGRRIAVPGTGFMIITR